MSEVQVSPEHYNQTRYDDKKRFISYWHQIDEVINSSANKILEIGVGNGFVSNYIREKGLDITTLDLDENLNPDYVGSILELPFDDNSFELVTCFEVLEHLPFEQVEIALKEMYRVSSKKVVVSVPDRTLTYKILVKLPLIKEKSVIISIPRLLSKEHTFDGQHYWELGKKGYQVKRFKDLIKNCGFKIFNSYKDFEAHNHHFFVLLK